MALAATAASVAAALPGPALAAAPPGSLDSGFAGGTVSLASGVTVYGVAAEPGGGAVVVGQSGGRILAESLSASGQPEASYLGPPGTARGVALTPGGDVVLAGTSNGAMIAQELPSDLAGSPVWSATAFAGQAGVANGVALEPDGSVVAAGAVDVGTANPQTAVARFGSGGGVLWAVSGFGSSSGGYGSQLNGVAVQPSGDIVTVGDQSSVQITNGLIAQLSPAGGVLHAHLYYFPNSGYTTLTSAATQPDGNVVAAGLSDTPLALAVRITAGGGVDSSFGAPPASGYPSSAWLPAGQNVSVPDYPFGAYGVGIGGGGRIIAAGDWENTGVQSDQALWAFTALGAPDGGLLGGDGTTSPGTGTVIGPVGNYEACGMSVDPTTGDILTAGDTVSSFPVSNPCGLDGTQPPAASGAFVSRIIGFGPPPAAGTPPPPLPPAGARPLVTTGAPGQITPTSAVLSGTVDPRSLPTRYDFQYGTSTAYGNSTPPQDAGAGSAGLGETATVSGLQPSTTYHYRIVASNADGTSRGSDRTFTTPAAPLTVRLSGVARSYRGSSVIGHGLRVKITCSQACSFTGAAVLPAPAARRLKLGRRAISVGTLSGTEAYGTTETVRLHLTKAAAKLLIRLKAWSVTLKVVATPAAGGTAAPASAVLHFKR